MSASAAGSLAIIVFSRVKQCRPLPERIGVWQAAVEHFIADPPTDRRFDLLDDGQLVPWAEDSPSVWTRKPPLLNERGRVCDLLGVGRSWRQQMPAFIRADAKVKIPLAVQRHRAVVDHEIRHRLNLPVSAG